jgi:hypothetical protein
MLTAPLTVLNIMCLSVIYVNSSPHSFKHKYPSIVYVKAPLTVLNIR